MCDTIPRHLLYAFLELYPGHEANLSRLSQDAEKRLFEQIKTLREELRLLLLSSDYVFEQFLLEIRKVLQGNCHFNKAFYSTSELNSMQLLDKTVVSFWLTQLSKAEKRLGRIIVEKERMWRYGFNTDAIIFEMQRMRNRALSFVEKWKFRNEWAASEINHLEKTLKHFQIAQASPKIPSSGSWEQILSHRLLLAKISEASECIRTDVERRIVAAKSKLSELIHLRNTLIEGKLFLVLRAIKALSADCQDYPDIIQIGCLALTKIVDEYNRNEGSFDFFAARWIRRKLSCEYPHLQRTIRAPGSWDSSLHIVDDIQSDMRNIRDSQAFFTEVCQRTGLPEKDAASFLEMAMPVLSLDTPVFNTVLNGRQIHRKRPLPLKDSISIEDNTFREMCRGELRQKLLSLSNEWPVRALQVIILIFGFQDGHSCTLREASDLLKLSPERIRQIANTLIRSQQHESITKQLVDFLD